MQDQQPYEYEYSYAYDYGDDYTTVDGAKPEAPDPEFLKELLSIEHLPEDVKQMLWILTSKDLALSYLEEKDIYKILRGFDVAVIFLKGCLPEYKINWKLLLKLQQARVWLESRLKRSYKGFERKMQATQISEIKRSVMAPTQSGGGGFLSWLFRR